jgi:glycosyltransferase involved in cell wall biosynthesis
VCMRVLIVHNRYQQKGGEDSVARSERNLLLHSGDVVESLEHDNDAIVGFRGKLAASASVFYSPAGTRRVREIIARFRPDVVHVHNWFPSLSPAIFWVCKQARVPVVHTVHNYRLLCAGGSLFRDGSVCEDCIGTSFRTPGIRHGCYRASRAGTAVATLGMLTHWQAGTWDRAVDRFIALSAFAKEKLVQGGLPESRIVVKPNGLDVDPGQRPGSGGYFAFVGRLSEEKGVGTLLACWRQCAELPPLRIAGVGPLEDEVRRAAAANRNIEWLGGLDNDATLDLMGGAAAVICPSLWYEGMPRVVIEALAVGTPILASRLGTYVEMISDGQQGYLFDAGNANGLSTVVRQALGKGSLTAMRDTARREFLERYSGAANVAMLRGIYETVIAENRDSD